MVRRSACFLGCLLFCLCCGDGVIQRVSAPPKDKACEVLCVNERILVEYRGELLAGCGRGTKRAVISRKVFVIFGFMPVIMLSTRRCVLTPER